MEVTPRPPSFGELTSIEAYKTALTGALESVDSAAEKILTAVFSVATAYGALIALVQPKEEAGPFVLAGPFVAFAAAAALSMIARAIGITTTDISDLDQLQRALSGTINAKRTWLGLALAALAGSFVWAGSVVATTYGSPTTEQMTAADVWLTDAGLAAISSACGHEVSQPVLAADIQLGDTTTVIDLGESCPSGPFTISTEFVLVSVGIEGGSTTTTTG